MHYFRGWHTSDFQKLADRYSAKQLIKIIKMSDLCRHCEERTISESDYAYCRRCDMEICIPCGKLECTKCGDLDCQLCGPQVSQFYSINCPVCARYFCSECLTGCYCVTCGESMCFDCLTRCECEESFCTDCARCVCSAK